MIIFKNLLSFGLTFKAYDWFVKAEVEGTMIPIASVQVGICMLTVPMCEWTDYLISDNFAGPVE
jgi:hypothetical protein